MRFVLIAIACAVLISAPASACRGLWEYPETMNKLTAVDLPVAEKAAYRKSLDAGWALHKQGRAEKNRSLMKEAVKMLDDIKTKIEK